ncbi:MAG: type II secretion system protein [Halioglobus sp.]|nr:type II secretion system protein [Halioglobus sp.]
MPWAFGYNSVANAACGFEQVMTSRRVVGHERGFSLLEMVVAVAILGFSLGALYHAAGGATRIVQIDEQRSYAVELARSLIAVYAVVPPTGVNETGKTEGGFSWSVVAEPVVLPEDMSLMAGALQRVRAVVSWDDGVKTREVFLDSVVVGREELQ